MPRLDQDGFRQQSESIHFEMDGERCEALAGESIAAALIAAGRFEFRRDKSGAPRGPLCGMGTCLDCEVSVNAGPPQRACLTKVVPNTSVRSLGFHVPAPPPQPMAVVHETMECDVFIVGAGPAGLTAAVQLAELGLSVIVADERSEPGGQFFKQLANSHSFVGGQPADRQYRDGKLLIDKARSSGARLIGGATVWAASRSDAGELKFEIATALRSLAVRAKSAVLATGAYESMPAFAGGTLPGVMTTGAAQGLARSYRVAPGQRVLIAGNGPLNLQLACELLDGGVTVVAIAEAAPTSLPSSTVAALGMFMSSPSLALRGASYLAKIRRHHVPLFSGYRIGSAAGDRRVQRARIIKSGASVDASARAELEFDVDAVCLGYQLQPSNELARLLGCKHAATAPGLLEPVRDSSGQTSVAGVFVIGDGAVIGGAHVAIAEGRLAANSIAATLLRRPPVSASGDRRLLTRHRRFQRHLWSMYRAPGSVAAAPDAVVCRCELVRLGEVTALIESGVRDLDSIKRHTRAGMGPCQGRYCQQQICSLLADVAVSGTPMPSMSRLPVKPTLIASIAVEKPEWHGYRTVEMPAPARTTASAATRATTQVLVIGAGIIGVSTALYLARAGIEVIVVDRGVANGQASGANAGSLHLQLLSWDLPNDSGADAMAAQTVALQKEGIAAWHELASETAADFELQMTGGIAVAETQQDLEFLRRKAQLERRFGVDVAMLSQAELRSLVPGIAERMLGGTFCAGEGKINPMLATPALLRAASKSGAIFRPNTAVLGIEWSQGGYSVTTGTGVIRCSKIVNASGGWSAEIAAMVGAKLPVSSAPQQMIVTEATTAKIGYLLALARRHLTMKQAPNGNLIIGGGWPAGYDAATGKAVTLIDSIEGNLWVAQRVIPAIGQLRMIRSWATIGVMIDGGPILGELPGCPGFFNAVGANGFTMGPFLGKITASLAATGEHIADIAPFSVERFH